MITWFLSFVLLMCWLIWTNPVSWNKSHFSTVHDLFNVLLNLVCYKDFCIYVHWGKWPVIFFSCGVFVWFRYQGKAGLVKWVWSIPSSSIFWKSLRIGINSSLNTWQNSPVKLSGPGLLFVGRYSITDSITSNRSVQIFCFLLHHDSVSNPSSILLLMLLL